MIMGTGDMQKVMITHSDIAEVPLEKGIRMENLLTGENILWYMILQISGTAI